MNDKTAYTQLDLFASKNDPSDLQKKMERLEQECSRLKAENAHLKKQVSILSSPASPLASNPSVTPVHFPKQPSLDLATDKKIQLFKSLFKGRTDVFPKRWEARNGQSGYSPSCDNEWKPAVCKKPNIKCSQCDNRSFTSLTDQVFYDHLSGRQTIGIYPLLQDDSCWFLAVDFDKSSWQADVLAFLKTCDELNIPTALERSRSGNGGHVWIFFSESIPAVLARKMGNLILKKTMDARIEIGLDSYDRLFPNQDMMPKGGFGNLIALPLQKQPRQNENSVFIDRNMQAYADQWEYLASIQRMSKREVSEVVELHAEEVDESVNDFLDVANDAPWNNASKKTLIPTISKELLPKELQVVVANGVIIEKEKLPSVLINRLIHLTVFRNPEFYKAQAMRMPVYNKPRMVACYDDLAKFIVLPRGCLTEVERLLESYKIKVEIIDERTKGKPLKVSFAGKLRAKQKEAVKAMRQHDTGVLSATTAFGKTVVAAKMIAVRKRSTLILVHRTQLLEQWRERLATFLSVSVDDIGQIGGGKKKPNGRLDIALLQSLYRNGEVYQDVSTYGHIIVDECHHLSAFSFEQILKQAKAKYLLGLTATPIRKDGHHPIIFMQCGAIRYQVNAKDAALERPFDHIMIPRYTTFLPPDTEEKPTIQEIYQYLSDDKTRNNQMVSDVISCVKKGRSPLLLTERVAHLKLLSDLLADKVQNVIVLHGGMGKKPLNKTREQLETIKDNEDRVILATGKYIGEGYDDPRLDTLFLAMPISWKGTLQQYAGRLHRLYDSKKEVIIYDYVDDQVAMLQRMYKKRKTGYKAMGYLIRDSNDKTDMLGKLLNK